MASRRVLMVTWCVAYYCMIWRLLGGQYVVANFATEFESISNPSYIRYLNGGDGMQLVLDSNTGGGLISYNKYLFGRFDMQMKLIPGDSAGTVTSFYLSSPSPTGGHDEIDLEFLGNVSGQPYNLQTNLFLSGVGHREQHINLWFDPTLDFHKYSIAWGKERIVFLVDEIPIRVFPNYQNLGIPYPNSQPMYVFTSIWNGDEWATEFGLVKINWGAAPFVATYQGFQSDACLANNDIAPCLASDSPSPIPEVDAAQLASLKSKYLVYNYCDDRWRNPTPAPECGLPMI